MKNKKLFAILTLVCFMFTLMPVAAFAFDEQSSYVYAEKDATVEVDEETVLTFSLDTTTTSLYVWFEEAGYADIAVKSVKAYSINPATGAYTEVPAAVDANGIIDVTAVVGATVAADAEIAVSFGRTGTFNLHAAASTAADLADVKDELRTQADYNTVVVEADAADSNDYVLALPAVVTSTDGEVISGVRYLEDGDSANVTAVPLADGAQVQNLAFKLHKQFTYTGTPAVVSGVDTTVYAPDVDIDSTSGIEVTNIEVKRNGEISFDYTVSKAGNHKIYITVDSFKVTLKVNSTDGEADSIELNYISKTPVNIESANGLVDTMGIGNWVVFKVYDAQGDEVTAAGAGSGIVGAAASLGGGANRNYVALTDKPADSKLASKNFGLVYVGDALVNATPQMAAVSGWTIVSDKDFDEEGTYTFKVTLDNGEYATASITVKEAGDPASLSIVYHTDSVQLGGTIKHRAISWLDKNYVSTTPTLGTDVELAVSGAAVYSVAADGTITVKDDEKYIGSEIKVTVVDEENNLVATKVLTVAAEAKELAFGANEIPVDAQRDIVVSLVDENGKVVGLSGVTTAEAYVVVLDKPANAEVDATVVGGATNVDAAKGQFKINVSADTVGTVELQAVLKAEVAGVVRYYTGTETIKVGATGIEDTVVMSIGANKVVVNDKVVAIDAAPMIKDSRTFVPFRALAEAFGAVVEFDAATQAVTAELDGTKVVMVIGEEVYTVNGVEKTADVAPFISDSRTMVPVRFVAEAFGITVTPIYAEDGSVADVLFTK